MSPRRRFAAFGISLLLALPSPLTVVACRKRAAAPAETTPGARRPYTPVPPPPTRTLNPGEPTPPPDLPG